MPKTWGEIKRESLELMFSNTSHGEPVEYEMNADYLLAMPAAANYALRDLASVSTPLYDTVHISHYMPRNMLGERYGAERSPGGTITRECEGAHSVYFELDSPCTVAVYVRYPSGARTYLLNGAVTAANGFESHRYTTDADGTMVVEISSVYPFVARNFAMYAEQYRTNEDVPQYDRFVRYDIAKMATDRELRPFMRLDPNMVVRTAEGARIKSDQFYFEAPSEILFARGLHGQFDVQYCAYPKPVTDETADEELLDLPDEALDAVPLYIASRLYAEDDISQATLYLNQYMTRRAELSNMQTPLGDNTWVSESGWI